MSAMGFWVGSHPSPPGAPSKCNKLPKEVKYDDTLEAAQLQGQDLNKATDPKPNITRVNSAQNEKPIQARSDLTHRDPIPTNSFSTISLTSAARCCSTAMDSRLRCTQIYCTISPKNAAHRRFDRRRLSPTAIANHRKIGGDAAYFKSGLSKRMTDIRLCYADPIRRMR